MGGAYVSYNNLSKTWILSTLEPPAAEVSAFVEGKDVLAAEKCRSREKSNPLRAPHISSRVANGAPLDL